MADLRANFEGRCTEVGMYLAMARVALKGYPEIGLYWEKAAYEGLSASKFAGLLGGCCLLQRRTWRWSPLRTEQPQVSLTWLKSQGC